jgi:hypothetical protein
MLHTPWTHGTSLSVVNGALHTQNDDWLTYGSTADTRVSHTMEQVCPLVREEGGGVCLVLRAMGMAVGVDPMHLSNYWEVAPWLILS